MNVEYLVFDRATGKVIRSGDCPENEMDLMRCLVGEAIIRKPAVHSENGWCLIDGNLVSAPPPSPPSLNERRAARRREAQDFRQLRITGGCETPLGRVQTDEGSQANILQALVRAQTALAIGEAGWEVRWIMANNVIQPHDAQQMTAMALAVGGWKTACFDASISIMAAIAVSDDPESVDITAGYPASA
nr:protein of unknown function DUF4376 [uncultured organism]